jgi:hypothetical protein
MNLETGNIERTPPASYHQNRHDRRHQGAQTKRHSWARSLSIFSTTPISHPLVSRISLEHQGYMKTFDITRESLSVFASPESTADYFEADVFCFDAFLVDSQLQVGGKLHTESCGYPQGADHTIQVLESP